jgi:transcriptional regulator with XRE-family HTH domain
MTRPDDIDEVDRAVGARLAAYRSARRLSEQRLADLAEISVEELRAIERGAGKVYASTLYLLSAALGAPVADLIRRPLH